jgi:hypothetical protein
LYNGIFEYNCPSDLKANKIIDIPAQARRHDGEFSLTTPEEFAEFEQKRNILPPFLVKATSGNTSPYWWPFFLQRDLIYLRPTFP